MLQLWSSEGTLKLVLIDPGQQAKFAQVRSVGHLHAQHDTVCISQGIL